MILFSSILATGEIEHRLFIDHVSLKEYCYKTHATTLNKKKVFISNATKRNKLLIQLISQLSDNLSLSSSLIESLRHLKDNSPSLLCRALFNDLFQNLKNGKGFAESLKKNPISFPTWCLELIEQGEENNKLPKALSLILNHLEEKMNQKKEIQHKIAYPCILLFSTMLFFHFLLLSIFPGILSLYESLGKSAPSWLASTTNHRAALFFVDLVVALVIILMTAPAFRKLKRKLFSLFFFLPLSKPMLLLIHRLYWLQNFTLQYDGGASLMTSFHKATKGCEHPALTTVFAQVKEKIQQGELPSYALSHHPIIPPDWVLAFQLGEKNNNLKTLCQNLIKKEKATLLSQVNFLTGLVEPISLLILGIIILMLIIALYAPLLSAYSANIT